MCRSGSQWFQTLKSVGIIHEMNGFIVFNRNRLYEGAVFLDTLCANLADCLIKHDAHLSTMDRVAGGAGCSIFAHDLARQVGTRRSLPCLSSHVIKDYIHGIKLNTPLKETERTLLCMDVLCDSTDVAGLSSAVKDAGGIVLPYLVTLWNITGVERVGNIEIVSLISSEDKIQFI